MGKNQVMNEAENKYSLQRGSKSKTVSCTDCQIKKVQGDVEYSMGNIVNNTLITNYGIKW